MCSDHKGRAIAVFGHRFCGPCTPFLAGPLRGRTYSARRARLACLPQSRKSSSPPPATWPLVPSLQHGDSNKSTGFYSCLSDILYSAGPGGLTAPPSPLLPSSPAPTYTCAIRYKCRQQCICVKYKERRSTSEVPCSGPYLLDSLHAVRFHAPRRSHGDVFAPTAIKHPRFSSKRNAFHRAVRVIISFTSLVIYVDELRVS